MVKKIKYLILLLPFFISLNVKAQNLGTPLTSVDYLDSSSQQAKASIGTWWDTQYYVAPFRIGYFTSATAEANKIAFYWGGANLCSGQNLKISGQIGALTNFFSDNSYSFNFLNNNQTMTCAIEYQEPSRIGFTCVGPGGGDLYIALNQHSFTSRENYEVAIRRDFDLSCEVTNLQVMQQDIINTQNIINSQNSNTQNIIANNNQTSQNIINNQNQNTQDIINNQNQNSQQEIQSQRVCSVINKNNIIENGYFNNSGIINSSEVNGITDYLSTNDATLQLIQKRSATNYMCFYDENKTLISCLNTQTLSVNSYVSFPQNTSYFRATIRLDENKPQYNYCRNGNQALNDNINNLNGNITNDDAPDTDGFLEGFRDSITSDTPITDLLTLPLTLINAYNNGITSTCNPYNFGSLLGTDIIFPCIDLEERLGSNLWSIIDSLCSIFLIYSIAMLFIHAFDSLTSLKDDFDDMYVPKHAGKHVGSGING